MATHEFGHALGLEHSEIDSAVMAPFYRGYIQDFELTFDDVAGIQSIYGANVDEGSDEVDMTDGPETTRRPVATPPPDMPDFCTNPRVDAITQHEIEGEQRIVTFAGSYAAVLDGNGIMEGYPKSTSDLFPEVTDNVTAALYLPGYSGVRRYFNYRIWRYVYFTIEYDAVTILFAGDNYYVYTAGQVLVAGFPRPQSELVGSSRVDVAFVWEGDGTIYLMTDGESRFQSSSHL